MEERARTRTVPLLTKPAVLSHACAVGRMEAEGPLAGSFDLVERDAYAGEKTWEKAESALVKQAFSCALEKGGFVPGDVDLLFAGDLLNQCTGTGYALRAFGVPHLGLFGACSTMAEGLLLSALAVEGGFVRRAGAVTSSHFCSAERQFRFPLEYGGQRTPTAQWTVTGAGAVILGRTDAPAARITHVTAGIIRDAGIRDAANMGAAMAPAAYDTIRTHLADLGRVPGDYDRIVTGDLGSIGGGILVDWFRRDGVDLLPVYDDCGMMIYDADRQDVHAGGSGCGCSAAVLCGHLLRGMAAGRWRRILFAATGALMSPTAVQQGESIPGICHALALEREG